MLVNAWSKRFGDVQFVILSLSHLQGSMMLWYLLPFFDITVRFKCAPGLSCGAFWGL